MQQTQHHTLLKAIKNELETHIIPNAQGRSAFAAAMIKRALAILLEENGAQQKNQRTLLEKIYGEKTRNTLENLSADIRNNKITDEKKLIQALKTYTKEKLNIVKPNGKTIQTTSPTREE